MVSCSERRGIRLYLRHSVAEVGDVAFRHGVPELQGRERDVAGMGVDLL